MTKDKMMNKKGLYLHYCDVTAASDSYTLSINLDCVLAPSIDMVNTKSISPRPSEVLCFVGLEQRCPLSATMWICNLDFTLFCQPEFHLVVFLQSDMSDKQRL